MCAWTLGYRILYMSINSGLLIVLLKSFWLHDISVVEEKVCVIIFHYGCWFIHSFVIFSYFSFICLRIILLGMWALIIVTSFYHYIMVLFIHSSFCLHKVHSSSGSCQVVLREHASSYQIASVNPGLALNKWLELCAWVSHCVCLSGGLSSQAEQAASWETHSRHSLILKWLIRMSSASQNWRTLLIRLVR